jgi:hypothetical protein
LANSRIKNNDDAAARGLCAGQMAALFAVGDWLQKPYAFCKPPEAKLDQGIRIVVKAADASPDRTHLDFVALAIDALARAWPCK